MTPTFLACIPAHAFYFSIYESIKHFFGGNDSKNILFYFIYLISCYTPSLHWMYTLLQSEEHWLRAHMTQWWLLWMWWSKECSWACMPSPAWPCDRSSSLRAFMHYTHPTLPHCLWMCPTPPSWSWWTIGWRAFSIPRANKWLSTITIDE